MSRIQRGLAVLAGLGATLIVLAAAAPAAFAYRAAPGPAPASSRPPLPPDAWPQPPAWFRQPHLPPGHIHQPVHLPPAPVLIHAIASGGMPGWQITLIAAAAALLAAALAVAADRAWAARRRVTTSAM